MCKSCCGDVHGVNPALDDVQRAKAIKVRKITDSAKLVAMFPAWLKAHIRAGAAPKPFKPDFSVRLPRSYFTTISAPVLDIPSAMDKDGKELSTAQYVAAFDKANGLVTPERAREIVAERKERERQERRAAQEATRRSKQRVKQADKEHKADRIRAIRAVNLANAEVLA